MLFSEMLIYCIICFASVEFCSFRKEKLCGACMLPLSLFFFYHRFDGPFLLCLLFLTS